MTVTKLINALNNICEKSELDPNDIIVMAYDPERETPAPITGMVWNKDFIDLQTDLP